MRPESTVVAASLIFVPIANAQGSIANLSSAGCHDVDSYNTCTMAAATEIQTCNTAAETAGSEQALMACGCVYYIEMMNCYMASCWNRVSWLLNLRPTQSRRDSQMF